MLRSSGCSCGTSTLPFCTFQRRYISKLKLGGNTNAQSHARARDAERAHTARTCCVAQGGQSVERIDHRAPASWFKALRLLDDRSNASDREPSLTTQILSHGRHCHRAFGSPWRFTPELLQHCEVPTAWNPYVNGTTVYCIIREPFSRFVSIFLEAKRSPHWPHRTCDLAAPLASQLQCFAQHAASILQPLEYRRAHPTIDASPPLPADRANSSSSAAASMRQITRHRVVTSEMILSMLPQSHFVTTGRGEPTCDVVFKSDHLRATGIPSIASSRRARALYPVSGAVLAHAPPQLASQ